MNLILPAPHGQRQRIDDSVTYPGHLDDAVARWLVANGGGSARAASQKLQVKYRKGEASSSDGLAAYLTTRLPATFAANQRVMADVASLVPDFAPATLLDCGAGPGTATWAALGQWASVHHVTQLEALPAFCALAKTLNDESGLPSLVHATIMRATVQDMPDMAGDLVIASYVLAELPESQSAKIATEFWRRTAGVLILIEPGTPAGYARLRSARETLRGCSAIIAPCTHANVCPMSPGDWCHFKTRLARTREHMHAKSATVPFEDEAFTYLVVAREAASNGVARIIAPVVVTKIAAELKLCDASGLRTETIASRSKPAYKRARKARWGDIWGDVP